ncbi:type II toxin-antitoxin system prevent-host-death family antitoxin [Tabrizicola sp. WMC-M-20]|nr:type II toxin-antitoxin system prevent-host-death family antitoxin [Tabrizicola sp. WMC-M-20]
MQIRNSGKGRLAERSRRAGAENEVMLTQEGKAVLTPMLDQPVVQRDRRRAVIAASAMAKATSGASAACSQDFLYDDDGLPG